MQRGGRMRRDEGCVASPRAILAGIASVVASVWVFGQWLGLDARMRSPRAALAIGGTTVPETVDGTGAKPYVLRMLVPSTVRVLRAAIPDPAARRVWLKILRRLPRLARALPALEWEEEFLLEYLIAAVVMYACLLGFVCALGALYAELYPQPGWRRQLFPLAVLLALPFFFEVGSHFLYDFATLFFSASCLLLLEQRRFLLFYAVFALSLFNKETAALVTLVFAARYFRRMPHGRWWLHLSAQVALAAAVRALLLWAYAANPGPPMLWNLPKNLVLAAQRGVDVPTALLFGVLVAAVAARWRKEGPLAKASLVVAPPLVAAYATVGIYGEIRIFYELVPGAALWIFGAVCGSGVRGVPAPRTAGEPPSRQAMVTSLQR